MNKKSFIKKVAKKHGCTQVEAAQIVEEVLEAMEEAVAADGSLKLIGFGTFETYERAEREGRNPRTGEPMTIPSKTSIRFRAGGVFKDKLNR